MPLDIDAGRGFNDDMFFNLRYVLKTLGYTDEIEAARKYCNNTPRTFLRKYRVNECDLCVLLANAPDAHEAKKLKEWITERTLKRPLNPKPLHADREELERRVDERSRGYLQYRLEDGQWQPEVVPLYRPRGWWEPSPVQWGVRR